MRRLTHTLVGIVSWIVFVVLWVVLVREGNASGHAVVHAQIQLGVIVGAVLAVTTLWIRHNVGIYRRKGPRRRRVAERPRTDVDRLGRQLRWAQASEADRARTARHLVVWLEGDVKTYRREG